MQHIFYIILDNFHCQENMKINQSLTRFRITITRFDNNDTNEGYIYSIRTITNITPTISNNETTSNMLQSSNLSCILNRILIITMFNCRMQFIKEFGNYEY